MSIMDLFQDEGYIYLDGEQIHRERSEVLLIDDLRKYLLNRYAAEGLTASEVDSIILRLRSISGTIYEANKAVCKMICDGFIFNREDHTKKDLYIELIDFDEPEKNMFKIVNQFEIEGINNQLRIPDGIVFINGIPVVVLEFKSAVKENTTISIDYFNGSPKEQLACLNRAVEYVQLTEDLETRFMAAVKRMKQAFNLCSSSDAISDEEKDYLHFYCAVRSILFKLTKGDAPDISQMNARVRELLEGAIQSDGIEELFETGKHISVDIFSDEYLDKINAIQLPNTKIKVLQRLLSQAIDEYKKVNRIMGMEFSDRLKRVVDEYNNRRRDEAFANEVLDDVAEQLAKLLEELKKEKDSFKGMGIDYEEKAFYDILKAVAKKYEFEYPDDKMIELSKRIKIIVDDKAKYTDWSTRDDIKANLQVDLILLLDEFDYPPVTIDDVYKEVLEQAENFKKYAG